MGTQITQYDAGSQLTQWREPEEVLAEAHKAAAALGRVIADKPKPVLFNNEQYLEFEDWQTVGKFYGLTSKTVSTRYVEYGGITGWEAEAIVVDLRGMEVGRAESMCMTDEDNWGDVPVYEWQDILDESGKKIWDATLRNGKGGYKAKKVKTDSKPKPMFQLRSMAQTRACAKAFRQVLSWVVVLGGFKPNVAEEMIESQLPGPDGGDQKKEAKAPVTMPKKASDKGQPVLKVVDEVIETAKEGGKGSLWLTFKSGTLVMVPAEKVDKDMRNGAHLVAETMESNSDKIGKYWTLTQLKECTPAAMNADAATTLPKEGEIIEGEIVEGDESAEETKVYFSAESVDGAQESTPEPAKGEEVIHKLFESGAVKKASDVKQLPPRQPGTIGENRATVLKSIISKNHKRTGFTWDIFEQFKADSGWEHTRDMPEALWEFFKAYADGSSDVWKKSFEN